MNTLGDYELLSVIGTGNHGVFYEAKPPGRLGIADEVVAIKVLVQNATEADFERFARELHVFASTSSPHLVTLYEAGQQNGRLFYVMKHYEDGSLELRTWPPKVVLQALCDAARGAHALHESGVVHRDIKPANILVGQGRGYLSDLGLALVWSPGATTTGVGPIGSVRYMEPDVIYGERATRSTDIWSLAITANEALSGDPCYRDLPDTSVLEIFRHVLITPPQISETLTPAIREVLAQGVMRDRADRYPTAEAFARALEAAGRQQP